MKDVINVIQQEGLNYRSYVPSLQAAIRNWSELKIAGNSLSCYERLVQAISGLELMAEYQHLREQGWPTNEAKDIARRCIFLHWDDFAEDSEFELEGRTLVLYLYVNC